MSADKLTAMKLKLYGIEDASAENPAHWLEEAIRVEEMAKQCGPFDMAYTGLIQRSMDAFKIAALIEQAQAA
jgi:hypothetical protein